MTKYRERVAEALANWALATRFADEHEQEMYWHRDNNVPYVGWSLLSDAQEALNALAAQSMTPSQKRAPYQPPPGFEQTTP
jgi:hypothetical protein